MKKMTTMTSSMRMTRFLAMNAFSECVLRSDIFGGSVDGLRRTLNLDERSVSSALSEVGGVDLLRMMVGQRKLSADENRLLPGRCRVSLRRS
jgi:hypothetical protein